MKAPLGRARARRNADPQPRRSLTGGSHTLRVGVAPARGLEGLEADFSRLEGFAGLVKTWILLHPELPDEWAISVDRVGDVDRLCSAVIDQMIPDSHAAIELRSIEPKEDRREAVTLLIEEEIEELLRLHERHRSYLVMH